MKPRLHESGGGRDGRVFIWMTTILLMLYLSTPTVKADETLKRYEPEMQRFEQDSLRISYEKGISLDERKLSAKGSSITLCFNGRKFVRLKQGL